MVLRDAGIPDRPRPEIWQAPLVPVTAPLPKPRPSPSSRLEAEDCPEGVWGRELWDTRPGVPEPGGGEATDVGRRLAGLGLPSEGTAEMEEFLA